MIPIVNDKFKYILFFNPKAACTSVRKLYLYLHINELSRLQRIKLNEWHNLANVFKYVPNKEYSHYKKIVVVRNPYNRMVSGFLHIIVQSIKDNMHLDRTKGILGPIGKFSGKSDYLEINFSDVVNYIHYIGALNVINKLQDIHFQMQSVYYQQPGLNVDFDFICKVENLKKDMYRTYFDIFSEHDDMFRKVRDYIDKEFRIENITHMVQNDNYHHDVSIRVLTNMAAMPSYECFLHPSVMDMIYSIYKNDFLKFSYSKDDFQKNKSVDDYLPSDFNWKVYLKNYPDLIKYGVDTEQKAKIHYINNGRYEKRRYN